MQIQSTLYNHTHSHSLKLSLLPLIDCKVVVVGPLFPLPHSQQPCGHLLNYETRHVKQSSRNGRRKRTDSPPIMANQTKSPKNKRRTSLPRQTTHTIHYTAVICRSEEKTRQTGRLIEIGPQAAEELFFDHYSKKDTHTHTLPLVWPISGGTSPAAAKVYVLVLLSRPLNQQNPRAQSSMTNAKNTQQRDKSSWPLCVTLPLR